MRKGRSSRKSRTSRPPVSSSPTPRAPAVELSVPSSPSSAQKLVIGIAPSSRPDLGLHGDEDHAGDSTLHADAEADPALALRPQNPLRSPNALSDTLVDSLVDTLIDGSFERPVAPDPVHAKGALAPPAPSVDADPDADVPSIPSDASGFDASATLVERVAPDALETIERAARDPRDSARISTTDEVPADVPSFPALLSSEHLPVAMATKNLPSETARVADAVDADPVAAPASVSARPAAERAIADDQGSKKKGAKQAKGKGSAKARASEPPVPQPDEVSVPPIGDLAVENFFSDGDHARHVDDEGESVSEKAKRKALPHVVERRARFARYVQWAVGISAVVCLAAIGRTAVTRSRANEARASNATVIPLPTPKDAPAPSTERPNPAPQAAPTETQAADNAAPAAASATTTAATTTADTATSPSGSAAAVASGSAAPEAPSTAEKPEGDPKAEKEASRKALEGHKLDAAIAAGERAVAIDPTDGESWLILAASYMVKGDAKNAQRSYKSCLEKATTRHKAECAQFAR